ncbi:MAG TPA: CBS domain-containing protein [Bryobacteraceae bacterium]|jgi:CBS domain-containing protein/sporulation protein YlmC with PRC-barrel domain
MAEQNLFLTELLGLDVFDLRGRRIGVVKDAAIVPLVDPSRVDRFLVGGGYAWLSVGYDQVRTIGLDGIHLKDEQLKPYHSDEYVLRLVRDLLDQQIIDAQGRKVVRITDVTFDIKRSNGHENDQLWVLEVDIGVRSIFRRMVQGVLPRRWIRRLQGPIPPNSIGWEFCNILESDPQRRLRLNISNKLLEEMHPADLAEIVENLSPDDREAIFETIDSEVAADTLSEVDRDIQTSILESLETEKAAEIVEEMAPDEAADALAELEAEHSQEILDEMDEEPKEDIQELLEFAEDTAGGMMNTEYIALGPGRTVADAAAEMRENGDKFDTANTVFLIDADGRLTGAIPVARLLTAVPSTKLAELIQDKPIHAPLTETQDRVTEMFDKYNVLTLPVVDEEGRLAGVITADDIITVLRQR